MNEPPLQHLKQIVTSRAMVVLAVAAIAAVTLRPGGGGYGASGCLLCGPRGLADFLANIILFAPLGAALALRGRKALPALAAGALLSLLIEIAQWRLIAARDANPGDVLANSTGVLLGWVSLRLATALPRAPRNPLWSVGSACLTCGLLLGALQLLAPGFSRSEYYLHWTPAYESLERYQGAVLHTRLGRLEWQHGPHSRMTPAEQIGHLLQNAPLELTMVAGAAPHSLAPVISISDENQEEVLLIGLDGPDLVYRFSSRANALRLDDGNLRVPRLLAHVHAGDTVQIRAAFTAAGYCIAVDAQQHCGRGFSAGDTWALLLGPHWSETGYRVLGAGWLLLAFLPTGMLSLDRRAMFGAAAIATGALFAGPQLIGFAATPWYQVVAAVSGITFGRMIGKTLRKRHNGGPAALPDRQRKSLQPKGFTVRPRR